MIYYQVEIVTFGRDDYYEIIIAMLNEIDFESFLQEDSKLTAYIPKVLFNNDLFNDIIKQLETNIRLEFNISELEEKNWNQEWENNFTPIKINSQCIIRADFHKNFSNIKYNIIINPKMSFGTGHHKTTQLMIDKIFEINHHNKKILDIGTGTGILAILASKFKAKKIFAIDNDKWAYKNAIENAKQNNSKNISFFLGELSQIKKQNFDIVYANINRNIILRDLKLYYSFMKKNSDLLLSGFLKQDSQLVIEKSHQVGFNLLFKNTQKWQILHFKKK